MLDVRDVEAIVKEAFGGPHVKGFRIERLEFPGTSQESIYFGGEGWSPEIVNEAMYAQLVFVDLDNGIYDRAKDRTDGSRPDAIEARWKVWIYGPEGGVDDWTIHTPHRP